MPTIVSVPTSRGEDTAPYSVSSDEKLSSILNDSAFQDKLPAELVQQICRELDSLDIDQQKMFVRCIDCGGQLAYSTTQSVCFGGQDSLYVVAFDVSSEGGLRSKKGCRNSEKAKKGARSVVSRSLTWSTSCTGWVLLPWQPLSLTQRATMTRGRTFSSLEPMLTRWRRRLSRKCRPFLRNEPIITELRNRLRIARPVFTDNRPAGSGESFDRGKQMGTLQMKLQAEIDCVEAQHVPPAALKLEILIRNPELQQHWKFVDRARFSRLYSVCGGDEDSLEETLVLPSQSGQHPFLWRRRPHLSQHWVVRPEDHASQHVCNEMRYRWVIGHSERSAGLSSEGWTIVALAAPQNLARHSGRRAGGDFGDNAEVWSPIPRLTPTQSQSAVAKTRPVSPAVIGTWYPAAWYFKVTLRKTTTQTESHLSCWLLMVRSFRTTFSSALLAFLRNTSRTLTSIGHSKQSSLRVARRRRPHNQKPTWLSLGTIPKDWFWMCIAARESPAAKLARASQKWPAIYWG